MCVSNVTASLHYLKYIIPDVILLYNQFLAYMMYRTLEFM